jgi:hypothetical protein
MGQCDIAGKEEVAMLTASDGLYGENCIIRRRSVLIILEVLGGH